MDIEIGVVHGLRPRGNHAAGFGDDLVRQPLPGEKLARLGEERVRGDGAERDARLQDRAIRQDLRRRGDTGSICLPTCCDSLAPIASC